MRLSLPFHLASLSMLAVVLLAGCGGDNATDNGSGDNTAAPATPEAPPEAEAPKSVDPASLPKLADYLPPLDGGAVEVAAPDGWSPLSRKAEYLVRFFHEDKTQLPRIEVTVEPSPLAEISDVTPDNAAVFADQMQPLAAKGGRKVIEPCLPLSFGDSAWSRHVRLAKSSSGMVQIQSLQTIRGGRLYTVELLVDGEEAAKLKMYKDFGYAVAAGMKFGGQAPVAE